ncbi:DUF6232 family protein [Okeania sp. KiyG1]|uniref:DUF6232 family protein n=1 Tax=Okeania sp. KiyG1 TaxID=2720165 RepID=UPI001921028D|nr:DUF6232 family protein [Okeania sp. KiyG1]GGA11229.1 hypothetical protein CYANOKiyG1_24210 [Okeania sp. KiyG1]
MDDNLPKSYPEPEEVEVSVLKVRGKTLIYKDTVYQINNITSIRYIELKTTEKRTKRFSTLRFIGAGLLIFIAIILLQSPNKNFQIFGLLLIIVDILLLCHHRPNKTSQKYGLVIEGNSGYKNIIVSPNSGWIRTVIVNLCDVMNSEQGKIGKINKNFNFKNCSIEDKSVKFEDKSVQVETSVGSNFVSGEVGGDVVSSID